ncbi:MAG: cation-translocating P-type ATPase [Chloroflexi bacterium]|nr:cation-translocating P-type ATPase [Chloroflexota bacterium]
MDHVLVVNMLPGRVRLRVRGLYREVERAHGIEEAVAALAGVRGVRANPISSRVLVEFDENETNLDAIISAIEGASPVVRPSARRKGDLEPGYAWEILRLAGSGVILSGLFVGRLLGGLPLLAAAPLVSVASLTTLFTGYPIFRSGFLALVRQRRAAMDTLISSATFMSLLLREALTGLVVVFLINLGDLLQSLTLRHSRRAIRDLLSLDDGWVWVVVGEQEVSVPIAQVRIGDLVVAHQGDKIAVDGIIVNGEAAINQATITGESLPVACAAGDTVFAGSLVETGHLVVRATAVGDETAIGRIIQRVEEASEHRAPIQRAADHFADHFVPFSFALSALVFLLTRDFRRSMSMLVIACPCAAGLATPTAVGAAIGNAARRGILIKGGLYLEAAGNLNAVVFDKTGTLTTGIPHIARVIACSPYSPEQVLALAAAAERHSHHPFAAAIRHCSEEQGVAVMPASDYETLVGLGVRAHVDGTMVTVGNRRLFASMSIPMPAIEEVEARRESTLWVALDNEVIGLLGVDDTVRPEASEALEQLRAAGVRRLVLATGDNPIAAQRVAQLLGLSECCATVLPEDKLALIRELQTTGYRVAMVGDGINDAPALAAADVGIALGAGGTDVAIEAADIALGGDDLRQVAATIRLSHQTLRVVRWNFTVAIGVNALGIALSAIGLLSPLLGAIVHNMSTVAVVLNSTRLIGYRDPSQGYRLARAAKPSRSPGGSARPDGGNPAS